MIKNFNSLNESRQKTIKYVIETKKKIKDLEASIKGMTEETKLFLIEGKIDEIVSDEGVKIVYLKDSTSRPSFQKVFDSVKDKLSVGDKVLLEMEYVKQTKESKSIMFG